VRLADDPKDMKARPSVFRSALGPVWNDLRRWYPGLLALTEASEEAGYNALVTDATGAGTGMHLSPVWDAHELQPEQSPR
jgi:hypothetical protein